MNTLLKQMWAQKKSNGWIFFELIIIFVITWVVVDPIYVIQYQRHGIQEGFDPENLYLSNIGIYSSLTSKYDSTRVSQEAMNEDLFKIISVIKTFSGVEAVTPCDRNRPWSGSYSGTSAKSMIDSSECNVQRYPYIRGTDYFKVFRYRSALDHRWESIDENDIPENGIILSENAKTALFGDDAAIGKSLLIGSKTTVVVAGVMDMVKRAPSAQPNFCFLMPSKSINKSSFTYNSVSIALRAKLGMSEKKFMDYIKKEMATNLQAGNLFVSDIRPYYQEGEDYSSWDDSDSTLQLRGILSAFFLIVIFLGVISTFWLRVETRKEEVGIRMALGSTGSKISLRLIWESILLVLLSSFIGILIMINVAYFKGMYSFSPAGLDLFWPVDNPIAHFIIVTLITLSLMLAIVVIATAIPATRASRIKPVDALRDE